MRQRLRHLGLAAAALAVLAIASAAQASAAAPAACDPMQTPAVFRGAVPTSDEILGFRARLPRGVCGRDECVCRCRRRGQRSRRQRHVRHLAGRAGRCATRSSADPENVTPAGLAAVQEAVSKLRDPETSAQEAERLARTTPVVLWLMGNVHGDEESATDAELRVLYELADRDDCAAKQILENAVVGIIPTQNPDGREAETRQNSYGFDMNRDWFARTQAETDTKLELLRRYPGMLYVDAHEMGGNHYFFPPTADPTYHEITSQSMGWQDFLYGDALAAEFTRQHIQFFTNKVFDFFAMVYGDTVPATAFSAAGMTFEKANFDPIAAADVRALRHALGLALARRAQPRGHPPRLAFRLGGGLPAGTRRRARAERGQRSRQRGRALGPEREGAPLLPAGRRYGEGGRAAALVRRLQRMDVQVYRLTAPLTVPDFKPYGRPARATVLPAGTYWIPMAQMQKHWIQAMLNENTYVPFPYFYDVSGWSNPLLST